MRVQYSLTETTHRHRNAVEHILHREHTGKLPRIRRAAPIFGPQLPVLPPMAVLRPAATPSKPFLIATWVKQEDSVELAEQAGLWRRLLFGANTPWNRVRLTLGLGTKAAKFSTSIHE
jgi:hypothetical protein